MFNYSEPFFEQQIVLAARQDLPLDEYRSYDDLKPYTIGVIRDNALAGGLLEADLKFERTGSIDSNVQKLIAGRVDIIAGERWRVRHRILKVGREVEEFKFLDPPLGRQRAHLVVSKRHSGADRIILSFNRGLAAIRADGSYAALLAEFGFGPQEDPATEKVAASP